MTENSDRIAALVEQIAANYQKGGVIPLGRGEFPSRKAVIDILGILRELIFPGFFGDALLTGNDPAYFIGSSLGELRYRLTGQIRAALLCTEGSGYGIADPAEAGRRAEEVCSVFLDAIPEIQELLFKDIQAFYDGDPAAKGSEDIIFSYPGFYAIFVYRCAHVLYKENVPLIPRIMTEYAHGETGIDINSGAEIGEYFFMDHGTGIVIGETTVIGDHVRLYQGVTLGALSVRKGHRLAGTRRHPTIEDNVIIYANATVLGGDTVIGRDSVIGGSAFVTESVPPGSRISMDPGTH